MTTMFEDLAAHPSTLSNNTISGVKAAISSSEAGAIAQYEQKPHHLSQSCAATTVRRALSSLTSERDARVETLLSMAREAAIGAGPSDYKRLKRQYSSIKNNFSHYDIKQAFVDSA